MNKSVLTWGKADYCHESLFALDAFRRELKAIHLELKYINENKLMTENKISNAYDDLIKCSEFVKHMTGDNSFGKKTVLHHKDDVIKSIKRLNKLIYNE